MDIGGGIKYMSLRMWRKNGPMISVEGKRGVFDISYGIDSDAQKLDVWLPEGKGPFPVIISIHGGAFLACDKRDTAMITPMLEGLKRGYAVIGMNYRLSGEAQFPNPVKDVKQAIRFIRANAKEWDLDADKMIAWGGSAGGYMSLMGCLCADIPEFDNGNDPNKDISAALAGGVVWYPSTEFGTEDQDLQINAIVNQFLEKDVLDVNEQEYEPTFDLSDENDFPYHQADDSPGALFLGCSTKERNQTMVEASPITYVYPEMPPIFLQHGSRDQILPMQQSIRFALKANEVCKEERVRLEIIPHAIHSSVLFETEENINKVFEFIEEILK